MKVTTPLTTVDCPYSAQGRLPVNQCRRLASTRRPEADSFANGPTSLASCWPGGPTTCLGDEVGERGSRSAGQDVEHRPPNVFIVEYRLVNPMTIHVVLAVRVTVIQAVMILTSPPTGLLLQYCTM